jgi:aldose 1-epimerase
MTRFEDWGSSPNGEPVVLARLDDGDGLSVAVSGYGATLTSIRVPDRNGQIDDVLLGFDSLAAYCDPALQAAWPYFGSTIGRFANRIGGARLTIDGVPCPLVPNEGANQLHGGPNGFDRRVWRHEPIDGGVRFRLHSPDGDQGFPGALDAIADYRITDPGELLIRYEATTDRPTHVNMAAHPYFNLAGRHSRAIGAHRLTIRADALLAIDAEALPLPGAAMPVADTDLDLRAPRTLGAVLASGHPQIAEQYGLNHCFVLAQGDGPAVRLEDPASGRVLDIVTTAPGMQVYTANAFDGTLADGDGQPFVRHQAIALEAQHFPDSPNRPDFPSTLLRPGETYVSETRLRFTAG